MACELSESASAPQRDHPSAQRERLDPLKCLSKGFSGYLDICVCQCLCVKPLISPCPKRKAQARTTAGNYSNFCQKAEAALGQLWVSWVSIGSLERTLRGADKGSRNPGSQARAPRASKKKRGLEAKKKRKERERKKRIRRKGRRPTCGRRGGGSRAAEAARPSRPRGTGAAAGVAPPAALFVLAAPHMV